MFIRSFLRSATLGMFRQVGDWVQYSTDTGSLSTQWLHVSLRTYRAPLRYGRPEGASPARQRSLVIFPIVTRKHRSEFSLLPPPCQVRFWVGAGAETRESKLKTTHLSTTTCRREHTRAETCIRHHQWICTAIAVPLDPSMKNLASWVATTEPTCRLYLYWFHISSHDWIGDLSVAAGYDKTHRNVMGRVIRSICFATLAVTALPGDCRVSRKFGGGRDGEWLGPLSHRCTLLAHDINSHGS